MRTAPLGWQTSQVFHGVMTQMMYSMCRLCFLCSFVVPTNLKHHHLKCHLRQTKHIISLPANDAIAGVNTPQTPDLLWAVTSCCLKGLWFVVLLSGHFSYSLKILYLILFFSSWGKCFNKPQIVYC